MADAKLLTVPHLTRYRLRRLFRQVSVDRRSGCWLWTGAVNHAGYGRYFLLTRKLRAHRLTYAWLVAPIPERDDIEIDHLCRRRNCINPAHLELVSHVENSRRARRDCCRRGHPGGLVTRPNGERVCAACERDRAKRYLTASKALALKNTRQRERRARLRDLGPRLV